MDPKLKFKTIAIRRDLPSDHVELAPVVAPAIVAYGEEDGTINQLQLALSELPDEARPATVARHLLPDGVRVEQIDVQLSVPNMPGRLGKKHPVTVAIAIVPEPRPESPLPAGHWVFVPAFDHACFIDRKEKLDERMREELAVLPEAFAYDLEDWRRVLTYTPATLQPIDVELSTTPLAEALSKKALADSERNRLALVTLDGAGRRLPLDSDPPLVGREALLAELGRLLDATGKARRSVLLVGEESAGKSAIVYAWARANRKTVWTTSASELVAGASGLGEWQQRIASVLAAAETLDAYLYFDDFGSLFADRPAEGGMDLGAAMRRHVVDGRVRIIGELTAASLDRAERLDVSLIGAMLRVTVPPTDPATTVAACAAWAAHWARGQPHRPQIAPSTVPAVVDLAKRFLPYRAFPGKAVRLLEELRVTHDRGRDARGEGPVLGQAELFAAFSWATGIPIALLSDEHALSAVEVTAQLRRRMIGQDAAVKRVAEAIAVAKARLQPADKPLASLFFVGPTGTGKTELARSVAAYLFGAPDRMVRLDMSEYTDPYAAERLFGGSDGEGRLTAAVRSQPFGVVLLDEIEKAHPSVFDLLLQVLGEARLTDGRGRTTYFHNAIIVLTSNLGTRGAKGALGITPAVDAAEREDRRYRDAVLGAFRPELVNRLDQIVVFHPLVPSEIREIAKIAVSRLAERRGLTQSGVMLDISDRALHAIAERGFSPDLGARALRRYIDESILAPSARLLARSGADGHGGTLTVRLPDETITKPAGSKLGDELVGGAGNPDDADLVVALWRRAAQTGRRMVRSALALGGLRRESDRELAHPLILAVKDKIGELEAILATAGRKKNNKSALPGAEIARLSTEHARLLACWTACTNGQAELRTAEELCLDALAKDIDAIDLIDGAILQRRQFRRDLFWLHAALRPPAPGCTLLAATPDARHALRAWVVMVLEAAELRGWRGTVHIYGEKRHDWKHPWGPPHDLAWARDSLMSAASCALIRIAGTGSDALFGLERGLHRFHGLAGEACHLWVHALERKIEFTAVEWTQLPSPPAAIAPRGTAMRECSVTGDEITVGGEEVDVAWSEMPERIEEAAVTRVLAAIVKIDGEDALWQWESPLAAATATTEENDED